MVEAVVANNKSEEIFPVCRGHAVSPREGQTVMDRGRTTSATDSSDGSGEIDRNKGGGNGGERWKPLDSLANECETENAEGTKNLAVKIRLTGTNLSVRKVWDVKQEGKKIRREELT